MEARIDRLVSPGVSAPGDGAPGRESNTWIVGDDEEVIVVDPGTDAAAVLAATAGREILAVICTHGHSNHVAAALDVAARDEAPVALNPKAAQLVGVNIDVVISFTFGLGSALAGAGGVLYALNYPSIDPLMGVVPGLKAFVAAVLGGVGNIPGAALGALILGMVETFVDGSRWSTYKDAIAFAVLIGILLFRPAGLLGRFTAEKV